MDGLRFLEFSLGEREPEGGVRGGWGGMLWGRRPGEVHAVIVIPASATSGYVNGLVGFVSPSRYLRE